MNKASYGIATWRLPDPRRRDSQANSQTEVHATRNGWGHIIQGHVKEQSEPWNQWFPPELMQRLCAQARHAKHAEQYNDALKDASQLMEVAMRDCLSLPFALLYERRRQQGRDYQSQNVWELLLEEGVVAVIHERGSRNVLWTAYFPNYVKPWMAKPTRFRKALQYQIKKYTDRRENPTGKPIGNFATRGPIPKRNRPEETCHAIHWVTLKSWGFEKQSRGQKWDMQNVRVPESVSASGASKSARLKLEKPSRSGASAKGGER